MIGALGRRVRPNRECTAFFCPWVKRTRHPDGKIVQPRALDQRASRQSRLQAGRRHRAARRGRALRISNLPAAASQARKAVTRLRHVDPTLRISNLKNLVRLRRSENFARLAEVLRKAGLPK